MILFPRILADVITADLGFLPGLALFGPAFGLPLSVLAAFLERPFYARAGIERWTILYSLQANLVSLLVGYLLLPITLVAFYNIGPIWMPVAVFLSIVVERQILTWRSHGTGFDGHWGWVSWANIVSAIAIVGVLIPVGALATDKSIAALLPYRWPLTLFGMGMSVAIFGAAFIVPAVGGRNRKCPNCGARLPFLRHSQHQLQRIWGSSTCAKCGVESDQLGQVVQSPTGVAAAVFPESRRTAEITTATTVPNPTDPPSTAA
jgi:hypothetical protein